MSARDPRQSVRTVVLLDEARGGDESAFDTLIRRVVPQVQAVVRRRMGNKLRMRVESVDIAQSVVAEAIQRLDGFRPDGDGALLRWLARLVETRLRREARAMRYGDRDPGRGQPIGPAPSTEGGSPHYQPIDPGPAPASIVALDEQRRRVVALIDKLPPRERTLVHLRRIEALDWPEILERSDETNLKAARNVYARAMTRLVGWLEAGARKE